MLESSNLSLNFRKPFRLECKLLIAPSQGVLDGCVDRREHGVTMTINDDFVGTGRGSRALGDPLNVLLWLVNYQSKRHVNF